MRLQGLKITFYSLLFNCFFSLCFAANMSDFPAFNKNDRILIMAPHPDDESIGAAGIIQKAKKQGAAVKVVCFTNGDHNELSFIVYEKRITIRHDEFIHMGEVRSKETLQAMAFLGLTNQDVVFLGYPDFGTMEILLKYWGDTEPFRYKLTGISSVPYKDCLSYGAPYVGESILRDIKTVIVDFKPTKIFVSHPVDSNRDHRSLYLFLHVALWDLEGKIPIPQVYPYLIHVVGWPKPRGHHLDLALLPPRELSESDIVWRDRDLTEAEVKNKEKAISFYKSQIEYAPSYLYTFARKNELFGDYSFIRLKDRKIVGEHWRKFDVVEDKDEEDAILSYALNNGSLFIKISPKFHGYFRGYVYLLGYNKNTPFSQMPKIQILSSGSRIQVMDKKEVISESGVTLAYENDDAVIEVPLSLLGKPDYVMACVRTSLKDAPLEYNAWRIIELY